MSLLAPTFGLSDVGLAKLCKRHNIPRPPRGYWTKLNHGKSVRRTGLPRSRDTEEPITIRVWPRKIVNVAPRDDPREPVIIVPDELTNPHPLVKRTEKSIRVATPDDQGVVKARANQTLDLRVSPPSVDRALRVADALIAALKERSINVRVEDPSKVEHKNASWFRETGRRVPHTMTPRRMFVEVQGESLEFSLSERVSKEQREPTPEERRKDAKNQWSKAPKRWKYTPTGRLCLTILDSSRCGRASSWSDRGTTGKIENKLGKFIVAAQDVAAALKREREEAEEEARRQEAFRLERIGKLEQIEKEEARLEALGAEVEAWHESQRIRAYVDAVQSKSTERNLATAEDSDSVRWIAWATAQADRRDPLVASPTSILDEKEKWNGYW